MAGRSRIDRAEVSQIAEPDRQERAIYVKLTELFDQDCTHFVLFIDRSGCSLGILAHGSKRLAKTC
jgi:hypothetical protein